MKICSRCNENKQDDDFYFNKSKKSLESFCRVCYVEYRRQHYASNKDYYKRKAKKHNKIRKEQNQSRYRQYLAERSCVDCGISDWRVLEADHLPKFDKSENISKMLPSWSWATIEVELQKCEIVCANCHRIRTYTRQDSWRNS